VPDGIISMHVYAALGAGVGFTGVSCFAMHTDRMHYPAAHIQVMLLVRCMLACAQHHDNRKPLEATARLQHLSRNFQRLVVLACVDSAFRALGLLSSTTAVGPCWVTSIAASGTAAPAAAAE
jgi:hypothetical protein